MHAATPLRLAPPRPLPGAWGGRGPSLSLASPPPNPFTIQGRSQERMKPLPTPLKNLERRHATLIMVSWQEAQHDPPTHPQRLKRLGRASVPVSTESMKNTLHQLVHRSMACALHYPVKYTQIRYQNDIESNRFGSTLMSNRRHFDHPFLTLMCVFREPGI